MKEKIPMNPETHQIDVTPCRECGGLRVPVNVTAMTGTLTLNAMSGNILSRPSSSAVALVCSSCGTTTLFAATPAVFLPEAQDQMTESTETGQAQQ
jgi:hypothetical protein